MRGLFSVLLLGSLAMRSVLSEDIFASVADLENLLDLEQTFIIDLETYIEKQESVLMFLRK